MTTPIRPSLTPRTATEDLLRRGLGAAFADPLHVHWSAYDYARFLDRYLEARNAEGQRAHVEQLAKTLYYTAPITDEETAVEQVVLWDDLSEADREHWRDHARSAPTQR